MSLDVKIELLSVCERWSDRGDALDEFLFSDMLGPHTLLRQAPLVTPNVGNILRELVRRRD